MFTRQYKKSFKRFSLYFVAFVLITVLIFPIIWMLSGSFKSLKDLYAPGIRLIPHMPTFENYKNIFTEWPVRRWLFNSLVITIGITSGQVLTSLLAGYSFARFSFRGKNILFIILIGTMVVPFAVTMIPNYILIYSLGGGNTYWGVIMPYLASGWGIFLLRQHIMSIPKDLFDVAKIDGANSWYSLWHIVLPLSKGVLTALTVLLGLNAWNMYFWPLLVLTEAEVQTVPVSLTNFVDQDFGVLWGELMAIASVASMPALVIYAVVQKHLRGALLISGLK